MIIGHDISDCNVLPRNISLPLSLSIYIYNHCVCVYIYICIYIYIYTYVYIYIYIYIQTNNVEIASPRACEISRTFISTTKCSRLIIYIYIYVCMYMHMYTHTHIHSCMCVCVYIYIYIYTCIYVHICIVKSYFNVEMQFFKVFLRKHTHARIESPRGTTCWQSFLQTIEPIMTLIIVQTYNEL